MRSWIMRALVLAIVVCVAGAALAQGNSAAETRTEANLVLPDLHSVSFLGVSGHTLLLGGILICILGGVFGLVIYVRL